MADANDDGGYAFPVPMVYDGGACETVNERGMSLRDYFAAKALAEVIRLASTVHYSHEAGNGVNDANVMPWTGPAAEAAYKVADAMLAERAKKADGNS